MSYQIDVNLRPLFEHLEETGILLDEEKLSTLIRGSQKRLAEQKQVINREVGFTVNLDSDRDWRRAMLYDKPRFYGKEVSGELQVTELQPILEKLFEAGRISFLIRRLQHVYGLASGNHRVLGRPFGLYPKYGIDLDRNIITTSEISVSDLPREALRTVMYEGKTLIKATYPDIPLIAVQRFSGDPWVAGMAATDLAKMGFVNLFEDYRVRERGARIFAITPYSIYLFSPDEHLDFISSACRECLENAHPDFPLHVDVVAGKFLDKLA
jgi:hypothetical protein